MRKLYFSLICMLAASSLQAQTVLNFKTHGLIADHTNDMKITEYSEPGIAGKNVIWDFSDLKLTREFVGTLDNTSFSKGASTFTSSNTVLEEFGNFFFFKTNETSIEQHGFMSGRGTTTIIYDQPFVKMKYPFSFGNSFAGSFGGRYFASEKHVGDIHGSYSVEGDAIGTLILPNSTEFTNALRVKEVKSYTQTINNRRHDIETTTHRWYVDGHRFPVLVLINITTTYQDGRTHTSTQAAYNPVVIHNTPLDISTISSNASMKAYPNPYHNFVNIELSLDNTSKVNLSVYDINGRMVKSIFDGVSNAGEQSFVFSAKEMGLAPGSYIIRLNVNGNETTRKVLEL